jgi:hypothetical protein
LAIDHIRDSSNVSEDQVFKKYPFFLSGTINPHGPVKGLRQLVGLRLILAEEKGRATRHVTAGSVVDSVVGSVVD